MADDGDAEWIDFGPGSGGKTVVPPFRPLTTTTARPRTRRPRPRPTNPEGRRPRPSNPRPTPDPHDASERSLPPTPPSNSATIISISVVTSLVLVILVAVLLYMAILKKKLRKAKKSKEDSQYSIRVEDVAHLDLDSSDQTYVNTTDLQKLVTTLRFKNKHNGNLEAQPNKNHFTTLVDIPNDAVQEGFYEHDEVIYAEPIDDWTSTEIKRPKSPPPAIPDRLNSSNGNLKYTRSAPPPPCEKKKNISHKTDTELYLHDGFSVQNQVTHTKGIDLSPNSDFMKTSSKSIKPEIPPQKYKPKFHPANTFKPTPPSLQTKPTPPSFQTKPLPPSLQTKPLPPSLQTKPTPPSFQTKPLPPSLQTKPLPPPTQTKPTISIENLKKNQLPLLNINLAHKIKGQDSGFVTPDTAVSFIPDSHNQTPTGNFPDIEPSTLSVTDKRAFLEDVIASKERFRNVNKY